MTRNDIGGMLGQQAIAGLTLLQGGGDALLLGQRGSQPLIRRR